MSEPEAGSRKWMGAAGVALLAAVGVAVWLRAGHMSVRQAAGESALPGGAGDWAIDKPAVLRSPQGEDALTAALVPYDREDFAGATASLEGFVATHPESPDGWFYLGASRLISGDASRARSAFDKARVLSAGERHPELEWLAATAEARTGAVDRARSRLESLCAAPSQLQVRACAAKESLAR